MAFVTRSHRHLWGKNNEAPLSFLFQQGLSHGLIKDLYLGWNKFGQARSIENWGFEPFPGQPEKLMLHPGIVVPAIVSQNLEAVWIQQFNDTGALDAYLVPGSKTAQILLGEPDDRIIIIHDLMDGLYLYQEGKERVAVLIHPDPTKPIARKFLKPLRQAQSIQVLQKENDPNKMTDPGDIPASRIGHYHSKTDLTRLL
ncbi:MAG: hypothetical protein D3926_12460 [Desulfobacteraceae bacterium]|nr:MAG: hypothetical protein D3926_12460 [Desulfobacteraceae bacterium]